MTNSPNVKNIILNIASNFLIHVYFFKIKHSQLVNKKEDNSLLLEI